MQSAKTDVLSVDVSSMDEEAAHRLLVLAGMMTKIKPLRIIPEGLIADTLLTVLKGGEERGPIYYPNARMLQRHPRSSDRPRPLGPEGHEYRYPVLSIDHDAQRNSE